MERDKALDDLQDEILRKVGWKSKCLNARESMVKVATILREGRAGLHPGWLSKACAMLDEGAGS